MARRAEAADPPRRSILTSGRDAASPTSGRDAASPTSGRDAASPTSEEGASVPECLSCGTCCFSELPEYVRVFGCDWDRMDDRARALTHFLGNKCYMLIENGHCAALVIDPVARRFVCSIYEARPDCCRTLERGGGACRADLHEKSERPLLEVARLLARRG